MYLGWRIEFRPYEIQLTDFENAAYAIFVVLLARAILAMGDNFYIPLSYVEENMIRAEKVDAVLNEKFWVNKNSYANTVGPSFGAKNFDRDLLATDVSEMDVVELSLDEIINGDEKKEIRGLVDIVLSYLDALGCDSKTRGVIVQYLDMLRKRASGELPTTAKYIRDFVKSHPNQPKGDCKLNGDVADDLVQASVDIGRGVRDCTDLTGNNSDVVSRQERESGTLDEIGLSGRKVMLNNIPGTYIPGMYVLYLCSMYISCMYVLCVCMSMSEFILKKNHN